MQTGRSDADLSTLERLRDGLGILTVHPFGGETERVELLDEIEGLANVLRPSVELALVVVHHDHHVGEPLVGDELGGLPALTFVEFAVADDRVDPVAAPLGTQTIGDTGGRRRCPGPSEPVVISTPGIFTRSGCDGSRVPLSLSVYSRSIAKNPLAARVAYSAGPPWPFDRTKKSRSEHDGFCGSYRSSRP